MDNNYEAQKKYLSTKKQLRVWLDAKKYEQFKNIAEKQNESVYSLINTFVDEYLTKYGNK